MNIQVPWSIRLRKSDRDNPHASNWWTRNKFQDDLDVAKRPALMMEDDLDHLGAVHKTDH